MSKTLLLLALAIELALHVPTLIHAQEISAPRLDRFGDPLPAGALTRLGTLRFHGCQCATYSPDGKVIVTAEKNEVTLWDAATSKKIRQLPLEGERWTTGLIFSHDGKKLAAIGERGASVQVWDLKTFNRVVLTPGGGGSGGGDWSSAAAFSSDDKTIVAATHTTLFVWDIASGTKLKEIPWRVMGQPRRTRMVAFSEDGKAAATEGDKKLHLWDAQTGQLLHEIELGRGGEVMKFSKDGKSLVVSGYGLWLKIFNVKTGKKLPSIQVPERVKSVAFSTDGKTLAISSSSTDGAQVIQLSDLANLQTPPVRFQAPGINSVIFSPDGKTLAWRCHDTLCFMDRTTGKDLQPTASHRGSIKSLVYHPDGKRIISASEDGSIRIWDAATGESLRVLEGHIGEVHGLALFPNGKLLASCGQDGSFRLWDVESGKSLAVLKDEGNSVLAAAFSADGKRLASGGNRGVTFLRDPATGKILEEFETHSVSSVAFSPDGKALAILGDHDINLRLLDLVTKKVKEIPVDGGSSVAYSPDGKILALACDETLYLVDTVTHSVRKRLPGHRNRRGCVVFSPDGRYFASVADGYNGETDRTIRVFEVASSTEIHSFKKERPIFAAAFSPDGSKLAVGGEDATAVILDLTNLTGKKQSRQLTESALSARWDSLASADASNAYEARTDLLHAPRSAVPFLAKRLRPAPALDATRVEGLIKKLDSNIFRERDQASKELEALGELVQESMRKALAANPVPEARQRLQTLLDKLNDFTPSQLRNLRALEILESIGTPESLQIIDHLARGNETGLLTAQSRAVIARRLKRNAPLPDVPKAQPAIASGQPVPPPGPVLPDLAGDPMPAGASARLGSTRWRLTGEPRRIFVSADGKMLAVVTNLSTVEILDARTGRKIEQAGTGFFSFGIDLRAGVVLSADWRKVAALETTEVEGRSRVVLAVFDRGKAEKVKIEYGRKKESYPVVPEEAEDGGFSGSGSREYISAADFSFDGKTLVGSVRFEWNCFGGTASKELKESHLVAWDASTGKEIWKTLASAHEIKTISFSPDGKTITVVDQTGVGFWDAAKGRELRRWPSKDPLFSARYSPDRTWLATGSKEEVLLWEVATGKVVRRLAIPGKEIKAIAFSPDGKLLAGGGEKTIRFWDVLTGKLHGDCSTFPNAVEAVAFSADGKTLFSGHEQEHTLRQWDVLGRKPSGEFDSPIAPVRMLSFSRDSRKILASSTGEDSYLWDAETGKPCPLPNKNDEHFLNDFFASSGQASLLQCEDKLAAQFAMLLTGKVDRLDQLPGFLGASVDGQRILVQAEKDKMPCFKVLKTPRVKVKEKAKRADEVEREFIWKDGDEVNASLSPDGKTVAMAGKNVVCFFDVMTGKERRYQHPTNVQPERLFSTQSVKFSADGSRIALAGSDGNIRVLAVKDGRRIAEIATKSRNLSGMAFSPDGQTLLTTSFSAPVYAWEVASGQMVRRLEVGTYLYSPDNRLLAQSAATLKVFDLYTGRIIRVCEADGLAFGNFAFSPNSKWLAASCSDTTLLVWPTSAAAKAGKPLDEKSLAEVLEKGSAADAYEAIGRMIADPERTLPFLERLVRSIPKVDVKEVQRLIADLGSDQSNRREAATKELARLGVLVEPALRAALSSEKVPESQKRIEKLLHDLDEKQTTISAEDVLHIRAIQALERIGTKRARQLLENLAQGAEASPRTQAAGEALRRLEVQ